MKRIQALYKYSLPSTEGTRVSFGQLLKETDGLIILSFPFAFMDESEQHLTWFRDHHEALQKQNIRIVGLGIDSIFALKSFREKLQLPFHLLSDANREVSRSLEILLPEVEGIKQVPSLSVVYFDRLRHMRRWGNGLIQPEYAQIVDVLQRQEVAAHG
ncbi:redoxin domain-containing protein [Brevibacillus migulae]|uniref:redoxin domain-containing protein n=1 Tax=Brevibacillus migulae TaxID=1644114 RepID=UPI00106EBEC8|nr:redoxin domain-containing protein [Brevibacillus migulae]